MVRDPDRSSFILRAITAAFLLNICQWGFLPLYPDMADDLGIGPDAFSVLAVLPAVMNALLVMPVGRYVDRVGSRFFLLLGALTLASGTVLRALSEEIFLFGVGQFVFGIAWPSFMAALVTAVFRRFGSGGRVDALGWVMFASGAGQAVGYVAIGFAGDQFGWRATSFIFAALPMLAIPALRGMRADGRAAGAQLAAGGLRAAFGFILRPRVAALFAMLLLAMMVNNGAIYLLPFALRAAGMDAGRTGALIVPLIVGMLLCAPSVGRMAERYGDAAMSSAVLGLSTAGLIAFAVFGTRVPVIVLSFFSMGLVAGVILTLGPSAVAGLAERTGAVGPGVAVGCARLAQATGTAFGPAASGVLYVQFGLASALSALAGVCILSMLAAAYGFQQAATAATTPAQDT